MTLEPEAPRCDRCGRQIEPFRDVFVQLTAVRQIDKYRVCGSCAAELRAELERGRP